MAQNISRPAATGLSKDYIAKLITGIGESRQATSIPGGKPLLRLTKGSGWVYGQNDEQMQDGSSWALNPLSIMHGFVAWTRYAPEMKKVNEMVGEVMAPIFEAKPKHPEPVGEWPYQEQRQFELRCLDGDDAGTEVLYKNSSIGGMRAFDALIAELQNQLKTDPAHPCPVLQFGIDSYKHKVYGEVLTPIFEVVGWADMNGAVGGNGQAEEAEDQGEDTLGETEEEEEEETVPLAKAPKAKAAPAPKTAPAPKAPAKASLRKEPTAPEPTSRRRPVRR